jgi:hypothetical protein
VASLARLHDAREIITVRTVRTLSRRLPPPSR